MKKFLSIALAALMLVSVFSLVSGAATTGEPIAPASNVITLTKNMKLSNFDATKTVIPDFVFTYTLAAGTADATAIPPIYAGDPTGAVVTDADFTGHTYSSTANNLENFTIDFSGVTFARPGIYRYTLTENAATNAASGVESALTYDTTTYTLDVYVENNGAGGYKVVSAVLYNASATGADNTITINGTNYEYANVAKIDTIENLYEIFHLKITKRITGNNADMNKKWTFDVTITGGPKSVVLNSIVAGTTVPVSFDANGTWTGTVTLGNNEFAELWSLPKGAVATVSEQVSATDAALYKTSYTVNAGTSTTGTSVSNITISESKDIVFTNDASSITPTGLFLSYGPYALIVVAAIVLSVVFIKKRKHSVDEV